MAHGKPLSAPSTALVNQVLDTYFALEKAMLVDKLRGARERKRATGVKVEGRKSHAELRPEVVELARQLRRKRPKGGQMSLRDIADKLFEMGHANKHGRPFAAASVRKMFMPTSKGKP